MKQISFFLTALIIVFGHAQQIELNGLVSIHNSKYNSGAIQYVDNAYVSAAFTKAASTDLKGQFQLEFVGFAPGTSVSLNVEKAGLEVVNQRDLEDVVINRKLPLRVYLAPKGHLALAQTELYNINREALDRKKDALIKRLRKDEKSRQAAIKELESYFGHPIKDQAQAERELIARIENLKNSLPEFAIELAQQNLDFASDLYIKGYEQFKTGNVEGAIAVLDSVALVQSYKQAKKTIAEGENLVEKGQSLQEKGSLQLEQTIESYVLKANALYYRFRYEESAKVFKKVIAIYKETNADSLKMAKIYDELGTAYYQDGQYKKALQEQLQAIAIKEQLFEKEHPELSISYNMIAMIYNMLREHDMALEKMKMVIKHKEAQIDPDDLEMSTLYNNLSLIYKNKGETEDAYYAQLKSLEIREKQSDSTDLLLAQGYGVMGGILKDGKYYKEAMEFEMKSLKIREAQLSSDNPALFTAYSGIAQLYNEMRDFESSLVYFERAISVGEKSLSATHPNMAGAYQGIGIAHQQMGNLEESLEYNKRALEIRLSNADGPDSKLASALSDIGRIYADLENYPIALDYLDKSLKMSYKIKKGDFANIGSNFYTKGLIFQKTKSLDSAAVYFEKSLEIREENNINIDLIGNNLYRLAQVYIEQGALKKAEENLLRVIEIDKGDGTRVNAYLGEDYVEMSKLYLKMNDLEKARSYREMAHDVMSQLNEKNRRNLVEDLKNLDALIKTASSKD